MSEEYERIIKQLEHRIELKRETVKLYKIRNKELKDKNNKLLDVINNQDVKIADLEQDLKHKKIAIQTRNKRIADLEKQIEKLEKESEENQDLASIAYMQGAGRKQKQLEQAKKIIAEQKKIIEDVCDINFLSSAAKGTLKQAEQFLNLSEKPNSSKGVEKC